MGRVLVGSTLVAAAIAACVIAFQPPAPSYPDGYRYGREGSLADHVSEYATDDDAGAECGEHADSDGVEVTDEWFRGCADGARHLPPAE